MSIRLIACDIGGVLANINKDPLLELLKKTPTNRFFDNDFLLLQRGLISPEYFMEKKCVALGICRKALVRAFSDMLHVSFEASCLKYLKVPYLFMSNINKIHFHIMRARLKPSSFALKHALLSCRTGFLKPHPYFYWLLTRSVNLLPREILFIDDQEQNCTIAEHLGIFVQLCDKTEKLPSLLHALGLFL